MEEQIPTETQVEPEPETKPVKPKRVGKRMTDKQKADLTKHMEKMKKGGMTTSEMRSHRMKLMAKLRADPKMTSTKAHKMIMAK
jgi:hypothetical protein